MTAIKTAIKTAYQARLPLFVFGPTGIGKSASFKDATDDLGIMFLDYLLTNKEPIDLLELPYLAGGFTAKSSRGIMLLDGISAASSEMQVAALQLIQERKIGSYTFPEGWLIMGAGDDGNLLSTYGRGVRGICILDSSKGVCRYRGGSPSRIQEWCDLNHVEMKWNSL